MQHFIKATEDAVRDKNWYGALVLALTMPDMCGKLETPNEKSQARFEAWYNKYLLRAYHHEIGADRTPHTFLNASDCYALRCAYLHQGEFGIMDQRARTALSHFHFSEPPSSGMLHCNQSGGALQLQVDVFCGDVCAGVRHWLLDVAANPDVQARMQKLGRIHPAPW